MAQQLSPLRVYDLLYVAKHVPGYACIGREALFDRLAGTLQRHDVRHAVLVGRQGCGKSALIAGFAATLLQRTYKGMRAVPVLALDTAHLVQRLAHGATPETLITHIEHALAALPACILVIDDAEKLLAALPDATGAGRILSALTAYSDHQTVLIIDEERWPAMQELAGGSFKPFEIISITELPEPTCRAIVKDRARYIAGRHQVRVMSDVPEAVVDYSLKLSGPAQPARALQLLDEVCAAAALQQEPIVTRDGVAAVFAQRTGQSAASISGASVGRLRQLRATLDRNILGQPHIIDAVTGIIERGWLGLKNPQRPLGSFLFLGPSGVGKTELARVVAREVYGTPNAFVRIDMSEYAQPHSVQRLIGAPPGYVGYEAGGQLTNAVVKQPFSLLLLDEIEKADPTVFDIFLQILEDGRLTDGQGTTVDFRQTIIMATSNIGIETIVNGWLRNEAVAEAAWRHVNLMPALTKRFRLEFLNRFEAMAVFTPFSEATLYDIAQLELQKIAERVKHHHVNIKISPAALQQKIRELSDPRFGARPLKRWLEGAVETELARQLLTHL